MRDITKEVVIKESLIDVDEQEKIRLKRKGKSRKKSFLNEKRKSLPWLHSEGKNEVFRDENSIQIEVIEIFWKTLSDDC